MELLIGFCIAVWLVVSLSRPETLEEAARREAMKRGKGQRKAIPKIKTPLSLARQERSAGG